MDALNFLLETTENLNDGSATMNDGLYLDMMNRLRDLHRAMSTPQSQPIIRPPPPVPQPIVNEANYIEIALRLNDIFTTHESTIYNNWFVAPWINETQKVEFHGFLNLMLGWMTGGYRADVAERLVAHPQLRFAVIQFMSRSANETTIPWRNLEFRDKFLGVRGLAKAVLDHTFQVNRHTRNQIEACLRVMTRRDASYTPEVRLSMMLKIIDSPLMGEWKSFRNVWKRRTEMSKLHELELTFDYKQPMKKIKVWTDRIQLGRTGLNRSTSILAFIHAIHEGEMNNIWGLIKSIWGNIRLEDSPHLVVSGITGASREENREYRGGWEETFRIRYLTALNAGGKK